MGGYRNLEFRVVVLVRDINEQQQHRWFLSLESMRSSREWERRELVWY